MISQFFQVTALLGVIVLLALAFTVLLNTLTFPRLRPGLPAPAPMVSILVPARDEADGIEQTVAALLAQTYSGPFELLVLDDHSADDTARLACAAAAGDPRFRLLTGQPLPAGWTGKNWACSQLGEAARGELLVFTDADVRWRPAALQALAAQMERHHADALTVWPTQEAYTWSERLIVPLMMFVVMAYLPEILVRGFPLPAFAAANGQCIAFRRAAYRRLGGHSAVRWEVVEDVALARRVKQLGMRLVMALGQGQIYGRMYTSWPDVRDGFAKNILAGHGNHPLLLLLSGVFHWLLFLVPWVWLIGGLFRSGPGWPAFPLAMIALGLSVRLLGDATAGYPRPDGLAMPLSVVLMTLIAIRSVVWHFRDGGPSWKGRLIKQ
ncbi:MAG: glycosyltransferase [Chloroflexota bacterium]